MRPPRTVLLVLTALAVGTSAARADLGPLEPLADLHRAVRESLGLPEPLIVRLLEKGLPDAELPVVGLIAARVSVTPDRIVDLRLAGRSWLDITIELGAGPEIFYVPFERDPGPPYGKAWGHYKRTPRSQWGTIWLADSEVVDLANVKLCADHYRMSPVRVVELRGDKSYAKLHGELRAERAAGKSQSPAGKEPKTKKNKSKGKPPG